MRGFCQLRTLEGGDAIVTNNRRRKLVALLREKGIPIHERRDVLVLAPEVRKWQIRVLYA